MKILVVADEESPYLWDYYQPGRLKGIDMIISCGDLDRHYLEFLVTMGNVPLLYVPGNHENFQLAASSISGGIDSRYMPRRRTSLRERGSSDS